MKNNTGYPSLDKPWLKYYNDSVSNAIVPNVSAYQFIYDRNVNNMGNCAIEYYRRKISYDSLFYNIDRLAGSLVSLGVKKGDIVTIAIPNIPENVYLFYALNKIGAVANFVDLRAKENQLINYINSVNSKYIFVSDIFFENVNSIIDKTDVDLGIVVRASSSLPLPLKIIYNLNNKFCCSSNKFITYEQFLNDYNNHNIVDCNGTSDDAACILHTSGTTSEPKSVVLTNKAIVAMAIQYNNIGINVLKSDRFFNQVPPFLAYNILVSVNMPLSFGSTIVMYPNYSPEKFAENLHKYNINIAFAGPADWKNFLSNDDAKRWSWKNLKVMASGSDKLDFESKMLINELVKKCGSSAQILEGYGMTELGSAACIELPSLPKKDSVGIPLPKTIISIFDTIDGKELPYNTEGEICLTGDTMMKEYYNDSKSTQNIKKLHDDNMLWIHSGDLGVMDENGILKITGRIKRIIVRHDGIKVSPFDIENIIKNLPFVNDVCVVGVNDRFHEYGFLPYANVTLKNDCDMSVDKIEQIINDSVINNLPDKYTLEGISILNELPLTPVGKVDFVKLEKDSNNKLIEKSKKRKK